MNNDTAHLSTWDQHDLARQFNSIDLSQEVDDYMIEHQMNDYQRARDEVVLRMRIRLERSVL